jgi:flagellar biosynthesis anti-sigma factor FlgM
MKGITGNPVLDAYQRMTVSQVGAAKPADAPVGAATPAGPVTAAAEISISGSARDLAANASSQSVDHHKVDELKGKIAENKYQIDSSLIAQRLIGALG